jgi:hypothetical protein
MKDQVSKAVNAELMGRVSISRKITSVSCTGVYGVAPHIWHALYIGQVALLYSSYRMLYELASPRLVLPDYHLLSAIISSILVFQSQLYPIISQPSDDILTEP